ncbi:MAG: hypothetical protein AB1Y36_06585 [Cycloclasticus sp.]
MRKLLAVIIILASTSAASAESISVSLKPSKGLSGTVSLNLHDDGKVTMLMYESPIKIVETLIDVNEVERSNIRSLALNALDSYLTKTDFKKIERSDFSVSFLHTKNHVSKNVTSKRLTEAAKTALRQIFILVPQLRLNYVDENI